MNKVVFYKIASVAYLILSLVLFVFFIIFGNRDIFSAGLITFLLFFACEHEQRLRLLEGEK